LEYEFEIQQYCKICGIDYEQGKNYKMVRDTLKALRDKSIMVTLADGTETSVSWLNKIWSNKGKGWAKIRFDEDIAPYLFEICNNTTRYELLNVLPMKSKYSVRMYEICRSWAGLKCHTYSIEELRKLLGISDNELKRYPDFRRKVLEIAQREINEHTDLNVTCEPIAKGRKVIKICLHIKEKSAKEKALIAYKVNEILDD
jgi:plasmid replication initiation protein